MQWWRLSYSGREVPAALIPDLQRVISRNVLFPLPTPSFATVCLLARMEQATLSNPSALICPSQLACPYLMYPSPESGFISSLGAALSGEIHSPGCWKDSKPGLGVLSMPRMLCYSFFTRSNLLCLLQGGQARLLYSVLSWHPTRHRIYGSVLFKSLICKA